MHTKPYIKTKFNSDLKAVARLAKEGLNQLEDGFSEGVQNTFECIQDVVSAASRRLESQSHTFNITIDDGDSAFRYPIELTETVSSYEIYLAVCTHYGKTPVTAGVDVPTISDIKNGW